MAVQTFAGCRCCPDQSGSGNGCTGWYCCEETGEVFYAADCAELAAIQCGSGSGSAVICPAEWFTGPGYYRCGPSPGGRCSYYPDCATASEADVCASEITGPYETAVECGG